MQLKIAMAHMMDWNDIRFVLAVAEQGTLQAAARELGVNHTTVWRRIQALEKSIGSQLLIGDRQGYRLTDTGEEVIAYARAMSANVDAIGRITSGKTTEMKGLIRLTAPLLMASQTIPALVQEFQQQHPAVQFEILSKNNTLDIERREADIAIRATNNVPANLIGRKLGFSRWSLYAHPSMQVNTSSLEELAQLPLIGYRDFNAPAARWYAQQFKGIPKAVTCSGIETALACAKLGMGIALLPHSGTEGLQELYQLPDEFGAGIWLLTHKELRSSARIKAFWDFVLEKNEQQSLYTVG